LERHKKRRAHGFCVENGFDILLTIDKNLQHQQNLHRYPVSIVSFNSSSSKAEELVTFLPIFSDWVNTFEKHKAYLLDK
jgi:hypothetical protein